MLTPRFVGCFMQALDDAELPSDPDFRSTLLSYIGVASDEGKLVCAGGLGRGARSAGFALVRGGLWEAS